MRYGIQLDKKDIIGKYNYSSLLNSYYFNLSHVLYDSSLAPMYYRDAAGALIVYDITDRVRIWFNI